MEQGFKELEKVDYDHAAVRALKFVRLAGKRCFPLHWHDRIELLRINRGEMSVTCGNSYFTAKEGDTVIINPKEVHSAIAGANDVEYTCVMFELAPLANNIYYGQSHIKPLLFRQMRFKNLIRDIDVDDIMEILEELTREKNPKRALLSEMYMLELISRLIEFYIDTETVPKSSDMEFTEVLDYIDTHFSEDLTIPYLSQKFGYDKSYFCRKFKAQTGITCIEYITSLRLDYAAIMLKGTSDSVGEISENCGFSDANYFSRCFKEKYGVSPVMWRKR